MWSTLLCTSRVNAFWTECVPTRELSRVVIISA